MTSQFKIYMPIMVIPSTNRQWLNQLLEQLEQLSDVVEPYTIPGATANDGGPAIISDIFKRRYAVMQMIPTHYSHVMWVDPDDLLDLDGFIESIEQLKSSPESSMLLQETKMTEDGKMTDQVGRHCCRIITPLATALRASIESYARGRNDRAYAKVVAGMGPMVRGSVIAYKWRQHTTQLSKRDPSQ